MTAKQHFNLIVRKALTLNRHLEALRKDAEALADMCKEHADDYNIEDWDFELNELNNVLEDLAGFDLEDAIPEKHTQEYDKTEYIS